MPTAATSSPALLPESKVPLFVCVEVAGALCERPRQAAYADARRGDLPVEKFGKRLLVPVARLEERAGRPITTADIARAEEIVRARKIERP